MGKEAPRRNPIEKPPSEEHSAMWQAVIAQFANPDLIEEAKNPKQKKRNRSWETAHRSRCYRGVPPEIRDQVKEIAKALGVPADEVAQAMVEYSLECLKRGTLKLDGIPSQKRPRMTLYASGVGWKENAWSPQPPLKTSRQTKASTALWKQIAYYRIPQHIHDQIKRIAGSVYPVGEVVAVMLKHGIESYESGVLVLIPHPKNQENLGWSWSNQ
ncbi:MAG: hypothetical protein WHV66_00105 [Anaerolineales bacterium]